MEAGDTVQSVTSAYVSEYNKKVADEAVYMVKSGIGDKAMVMNGTTKYSWKDAGVDTSFGGATTAAAEAQGLEEAPFR